MSSFSHEQTRFKHQKAAKNLFTAYQFPHFSTAVRSARKIKKKAALAKGKKWGLTLAEAWADLSDGRKISRVSAREIAENRTKARGASALDGLLLLAVIITFWFIL